jgi:D-alanyl-D-alanine carboxypeptidase/D-alanyl-D-alanine-endopeptidase (penicillin-binding protein 4)
LATIVAAVVLTTACGTHRAPAPTPASLGRDPATLRLQQDLDTLLADPALERGSWGIAVRSLSTGGTLYQSNGQKLFVPASNMKIVTLAAAAERLGWDYSYETTLAFNGPLKGDLLEGDLIVVGTGDPSIEAWDASAISLFRQWAEQLKASGLRGISGRIIGDDNVFEDEGLGAGWAWDDLDRSFATAVGALQFNQSTIRLTLTPGRAAGDPVAVNLTPENESGLELRSFLKTGAPVDVTPITTRRLPGTAVLEIRGTLVAGGSAVVRLVSAPNPTTYFVNALGGALNTAGIASGGSPVDIDDIGFAPVTGALTPLLSHRSPDLATLARTMMKDSQNLYAETLLKTIGIRNGVGTAAAGREAVVAMLQKWGVGAGDVVVADGSGLSRYNLVTPHALVRILASVHQDARQREPFMASLPIAGRDGTLASRMRGTHAEGNARAKTGSLSNARALSGYVQTADGEPLVFSLLANNFGVSADIIDRTMDAIVVRLAEFARR